MTYKKMAIAAIAASLSLVLTGCNVGEARPADSIETIASTPLPVEVILPRNADIFATYNTTTSIAADADAPIPARVEGEVVEILVEEGDQVQLGQLLARLDGERLRLELRQAEANLEKTTREFQRFTDLQERGLVSAAAVDSMRYDMEALEASFALKRLFYSYTEIRAPITGVVSTRSIKVGQHISVSDLTFRITNTSKLVAYLKIPQSELTKFSAGIVATVRVDAMPEHTFSALIARISPTIDARNGTFRATAFIENDAGLLAPGMFGRFEIAYEKHTNALLIPAAAIVEEDNQSIVYIVDNGSAVRRTIEVGIEQDGNVEVLGGLDGDERIIVTGQTGLRDGSKVLASIPAIAPVTG